MKTQTGLFQAHKGFRCGENPLSEVNNERPYGTSI